MKRVSIETIEKTHEKYYTKAGFPYRSKIVAADYQPQIGKWLKKNSIEYCFDQAWLDEIYLIHYFYFSKESDYNKFSNRFEYWNLDWSQEFPFEILLGFVQRSWHGSLAIQEWLDDCGVEGINYGWKFQDKNLFKISYNFKNEKDAAKFKLRFG